MNQHSGVYRCGNLHSDPVATSDAAGVFTSVPLTDAFGDRVVSGCVVQDRLPHGMTG